MGIFVYFFVFLTLAIFMSGFTADIQKVQYEDTKLSIAVIDRDHSRISEALKEFVGEKHEIVPLEDKKDMIQDALFSRLAEYVLIIPEGFGEQFTGDTPVQAENLKVPGSYTGYLIDGQIESYLKYLRLCLKSGAGIEEAAAAAEDIIHKSVPVKMQDESVLSDMRSVFYYSQYLPFVFIAIMCVGISSPLVAFMKRDMKMRVSCGALSVRKRNTQIVAAVGVCAAAVWIIFMTAGIILYHRELDSPGIPYVILNSASILLVSAAIAFVMGMNIKRENVKWAMVNVFSLGLSFLGGVFVPQTIMDSSILSIARFTPTYWYVRNNTLAGTAAAITGSVKNQIWAGILIQIGFAVAIFAAGLVAVKEKEKRN